MVLTCGNYALYGKVIPKGRAMIESQEQKYQAYRTYLRNRKWATREEFDEANTRCMDDYLWLWYIKPDTSLCFFCKYVLKSDNGRIEFCCRCVEQGGIHQDGTIKEAILLACGGWKDA